jgi:hypothetical protein
VTPPACAVTTAPCTTGSRPRPRFPRGDDGEPERILPAAEIERALGQTVRETLDRSGWDSGGGLEGLLTRVTEAVGRSVQTQRRLAGLVRGHVLRRLPEFPDAPELAGVYPVPERLLGGGRAGEPVGTAEELADGAGDRERARDRPGA